MRPNTQTFVRSKLIINSKADKFNPTEEDRAEVEVERREFVLNEILPDDYNVEEEAEEMGLFDND